MRPFASLLVAAVASLALTACEPPTQESAALGVDTTLDATPWTSLDAQDDPQDFSFAVLSDRTGGHRPGVFGSAMPRVNRLAPAFTINVGDLIEGYTEDPARLTAEWDEIESYIAQLEAPFFYTPGNHDMDNAVMAEEWQRRFGPSFYKFTYKGVLFLVLNSELFGMVGDPDTPVPGPWTQGQQMEFIEQTLAAHADARWTVVLVHQPLWDPSPGREIHPDWLRVEALLGNRAYTVFAGHYHQYTLATRNDRRFITLATTGGGSPLRGAAWGEFDQIALVRMTRSGPRVANLTLGGILPADVSTTESRARLQALSQSVQVSVPVLRTARFNETTAKFSIRNPLSAELHASPRVTAGAGFEIGPVPAQTIAPGSIAEVAVPLTARDVDWTALRTATVHWTLTAAEAGTPLQVVVPVPLRPLNEMPIPATTTTIQVDGSLQDWAKLPFLVDRQGDPSLGPIERDDLSFRFAVAQDAANLYIAAEVTDDVVINDPSRMARLQDAIAIAVDTRPPAARDRNMPVVPAIVSGFYGEMIVQILTPGGATSDTFITALDEVANEVTSAFARTDVGYNIEIAIPHSALDRRAGETWEQARIGIRAYDLDDENHGGVEVLHWQPYRFGNAPLPGSHAFARH